MSERNRQKDFVEIRAVYYYICKNYAIDYGCSRASRLVNRHHATCLHSINMIDNARYVNFIGYESLEYKLIAAEKRIAQEKNIKKFSVKEKLDYYRRKYFELKLTA